MHDSDKAFSSTDFGNRLCYKKKQPSATDMQVLCPQFNMSNNLGRPGFFPVFYRFNTIILTIYIEISQVAPVFMKNRAYYV